MKVNVICMKWGEKYGPEYVNKLYSMVQRNLTIPHNFICITDSTEGIRKEVKICPIPSINVPSRNDVSPWRKLLMFSKELGDIKGKTLFLDLDIVIVDNIDCFFEYSDDFCIIENWTQKGRGIGNSSVYAFEFGKYEFVLNEFLENMDEILKKYDNEQIYLSKRIGNVKFWPEKWCKSFKIHCLPGGLKNLFVTPSIPEGTKIVVFHGNPKPSDAIAGKWPGTIRKFVRKTPWVADYWG
ncbi:MAG: hypothetical protein K0T99_02310 [Alphaproteobacteria bacterium]|nr:hypothetical protein [Alphaproteobacteria bacterium]